MTDPNYTDQDTYGGATPAGGLTREMKLLLAALATLLLAGALAFYFNSRNTDADTVDTTVTESTVVTETGDASSTTVTTVSTTNVAGAPGTVSGNAAAPGTIPPLSSAPAAVANPAKLGGINPDTPLAAVPSRNPFKPLKLTKDGSTPAGAVADNGSALQPAPEPQPSFAEPSVAIAAPPRYSEAGSPSFPAAGTGASSGTESSSPSAASRSTSAGRSSSSTGTSSGAGQVSSAGSRTSGATTTWVLGPDSTPVAVTGSAASASRTPASSASNSSTGNSGRGNASTGNSTSGTASAGRASSSTARSTGSAAGTGRPATAPAPATSGTLVPWAFDNPDDYPEAVPAGTLSGGRSSGGGSTNGRTSSGAGSAPSTGPVAGVAEPDLGAVASRPRTGSGASTGAGGTPASALSVPLPAPGQPDLLTQYGDNQGVGAPNDSTLLSRTLNRQNLRFTGAVLGPTDTAIFKSSQGFMVLAKGDRLPDTDIVVEQITANSVTLALGQDSLKLELEPLQ